MTFLKKERGKKRALTVAEMVAVDRQKLLTQFNGRSWMPRLWQEVGALGAEAPSSSAKCARLPISSNSTLGYVSRQLGYADLATTARHYARYVDEDYRQPLSVEPGEVSADLLAKLVEVTPHVTPVSASGEVEGA